MVSDNGGAGDPGSADRAPKKTTPRAVAAPKSDKEPPQKWVQCAKCSLWRQVRPLAVSVCVQLTACHVVCMYCKTLTAQCSMLEVADIPTGLSLSPLRGRHLMKVQVC